MSPLVLDCSVVIAWLFEDEESNFSERALEQLAVYTGIVPTIWPLEVANTLAIAERRGRINEERLHRNVEVVLGLEVEVDEFGAGYALSRTLSIARHFNLTVYDASYLELARRSQGTLVTLDKRLRKAATEFSIPLFT